MGACRFLHWSPPDDVIQSKIKICVPENIVLQKKHWLSASQPSDWLERHFQVSDELSRLSPHTFFRILILLRYVLVSVPLARRDLSVLKVPLNNMHTTPCHCTFISFHCYILNSRLGFSANPFLHRPFPFLPDWFHILSDHLMILLCSVAGFVCMVC